MSRFRSFFKRSKKPTQQLEHEATSSSKQYGHVPETTTDIANLPVAGMQKSNQLTYITSYSSTEPSSSVSTQRQTSSTLSSSASTAVDAAYVSRHGESQWRGKPIGQPYDRREELTEEDEDMWARMAM
ncbi:hypothetical protein OHC33_004574 [Knufia fluminis]|uniref:Uncharacterized protein n=1 Tax=Knufia fluminis TaxID=191047 RepID=A0AAN8EMQ1_9EURO|nr:hypothetical protein OHC33_004574 [Knufia fluminis]